MKYQIEIPEENLPVISAVALEALELCKDPDVTSQRIEKLVMRDPALTARLLHIANSPFYVRRMMSRTVADAAVRLGLRQLRNIILAAATGELFAPDDPHAQRLWQQAQLNGQVAQLVAERLLPGDSAEAYIGGLLRDIGSIAIYLQFPEIYAELLRQVHEEAKPLLELEQATFEYFDHTMVGGLVVRKWRLPVMIADCARFHHQSLDGELPETLENPKLVRIIGFAGILTETLERPDVEPTALLDSPGAREIGLNAPQLEKIMGKVRERIESAQAA